VAIAAQGPDELRAHLHEKCRLRVMKLSFDGFEQEELLVPVAVFEDGSVLEPAHAAQLLRLTLQDGGPLEVAVTEEVLGDAVDEALFSIQSSVDEAEQVRFARASQQAENYVEDRLLVLKARRTGLLTRLEQAQQRLVGAVGSEMRGEIEGSLVGIQTALDEVEGAIARLDQRDDATFRNYREHIHRRRYAPPRVEKLFDLDLVIE
jgi:hypothetical protein